MVTLWTMTIDTEEEWEWGNGWPVSRVSLQNVQNLPTFQDCCEKYGAAVTYFVVWSVLNERSSRQVVLDLAERPRVEIGMHVHPWCTPPIDNPTPTTSETYIHNLPEEKIRAKLTTVYEAFREQDLHPVSFRGGRYSSGKTVHDFLREKGFLADVSAIPFTKLDDPDAPDYRHRDLRPRRLPPNHRYDKPFWDLPLTMGFTRRPTGLWRRFYQQVEGSWLRRLRLIGIAEALGLVKRIWLNFEVFSAKEMLQLLKALRPRRLPFICFTVHSSSLMAGGNPYVRTKEEEQQLVRNVEEVFSTISEWPEFRPATVAGVTQRLEAGAYASIGN